MRAVLVMPDGKPKKVKGEVKDGKRLALKDGMSLVLRDGSVIGTKRRQVIAPYGASEACVVLPPDRKASDLTITRKAGTVIIAAKDGSSLDNYEVGPLADAVVIQRPTNHKAAEEEIAHVTAWEHNEAGENQAIRQAYDALTPQSGLDKVMPYVLAGLLVLNLLGLVWVSSNIGGEIETHDAMEGFRHPASTAAAGPGATDGPTTIRAGSTILDRDR